jgi:hypothetical protein
MGMKYGLRKTNRNSESINRVRALWLGCLLVEWFLSFPRIGTGAPFYYTGVLLAMPIEVSSNINISIIHLNGRATILTTIY